MLIRQTLIIPPNLPNQTVLPHATRTLCIVLSQTSASIVNDIARGKKKKKGTRTVDDNYGRT